MEEKVFMNVVNCVNKFTMKNIFLSLGILFCTFLNAQHEHFCSKAKSHSASAMIAHQQRMSQLVPQISHELKYDVKFVHLNLNLERTNKVVSGGVKTVAAVIAASLDTFQTLLHQVYTIDSIRFNGVLSTYLRQDSLIKIKPASPLANGTSFTVIIYYNGTAPTGGGAIGSGYSNASSQTWGNQVSWSLSEALVGYHWWPCKQILTDKIDSSWVYVTTDSANKVGSNGILQNVVTIATKKRYEWKSHKPIDYYLISVAVAKYKEYKLYAHPLYLPGDSIFIQNYIYDNAINNPTWINGQKIDLNKMPQVLEFESKMYGMYPFYKEKYGHCMAPFGGGMEHQTMTSLGFFDYYVDAHELGHQWWGDNVTCKGWGNIWINEGFASYTEHLVAQYLDNANFATNLNGAHNSVMSQPGGSVFFTDTLNTTRIFSSRLTYDKGGAIIHSLRFLTNNDSAWFNALRGFQNTYKNSTASAEDFKAYYQTSTGVNAVQFFDQWYYGEGYPTFNVKFASSANVCYIQSTQSTSTPSSVPLFITPIEYKIQRTGGADTTVRVMHSNTIETYTFALTGTVTNVICDPGNWIINRVIGPVEDQNIIGMEELSLNASLIHIGPNPTKGILTVKNSSNTSLNFQLTDMNGKLLQEKLINGNSEFDLSTYSGGTYFVSAKDAEGKEIVSKKVVKQ
jgi:aminopeptidase N